MSKLSDKQKVELVELYKTGKYSYTDLAKYFGLNPSAIRPLLKRRGLALDNIVDTTSSKITVSTEEEKRILEMYRTGDYTCRDIDRILDKRSGKALLVLNKNNVEIFNNKAALSRQYTLNENLLNNIDTEEKAWVLGWLYSDGFHNEDKGYLEISLQKRDVDVLEKINSIFNSNKPISDYKKKKDSYQDVCRLVLTSRILSKDLTRAGCHQRKSLTLKFPGEEIVPKHLIKHFIRGYFEGDGSLGCYKNNRALNKLTISLISTEEFCLQLNNILEEEIGARLTIHHDKRVTNKTTRSMTGHCLIAAKFLDWIYRDATVWMNRKYDLHQTIKDYRKDNISPKCRKDYLASQI